MKETKGLQMDIKNHFFLTILALFSLGVIVTRPGNTFRPVNEDRSCKLDKGKMTCVYHYQEDRISKTIEEVRYQYQ